MCNGLRQVWGRAIATIVVTIACAHAAHAQLPGVQLPQLPRVDLPTTLNDTVNGAAGTVRNELGTAERLADLRQIRIRDLLRTQRQFVERDPAGAPILRAEIVAFSPSEAALDAARGAGFTVARERNLEGLDARVIVLHAPDRMSTRRALSRLRSLDPSGSYDYNHIYLDSGEENKEKEQEKEKERGREREKEKERENDSRNPGSLSSSASSSSSSAEGVKVGLVDGGVDASHPIFAGSRIHHHGCNDKLIPSEHGTAVASLMIGQSDLFQGSAPGAELFAADVYCGSGAGGAVDSVVDAIAWLAREHVPVINVSLVGPKNLTLENVVRVVVAKGYIIVAAVGNDGASAAPLYPASYEGVIGVTAVDSKRKVLLEACRGPQVDFAAPGADMAAAMLSPSFASVRGTSFAAPIVAGFLATQLHEPGSQAAEKAVSMLVAQAQDLGSRGFDKVYGNGLVGGAVRTELSQVTENQPLLGKSRE